MSAAVEMAAKLKAAFPGLRVTSTDRTPAQQAELVASGATRARNSQHLSGTGIDVVLPKNISTAQVRNFLSQQGVNPGEFLLESGNGAGQGTGAHLHIGLAQKGGDQASRSDPAAEVRAYRTQRNAGPDVSQYPDIRAVAASQLRRSTPLPQEVLDSYNSHKMSDEDRAVVDKYIKTGAWFVPKGQRLHAPPPRTAGESFGMGTRGVLEGAGGLVDIVAGPVNAIVNALPGEQGLSTSPFRDLGASASDAMGLANPESSTEKLIDAGVQGGTQGLLTAGAGVAASGARGTAGVIGKALAANPVLDTVSGATSGASQETARQSGAGPVGQVVAGLAGGAAPIGLAATGERAASRIRAPKSLPEAVAQTPRAAVIDESGNLTPHGQEIATRHNVTPEQVVAAYEAPPSVQRRTANDQMPDAVAREATNGEPVFEPASARETPEGGSEMPPQPNAPSADQPSPDAIPVAPTIAKANVDNAAEFGIDMSRGQATKNFDIQDRENRLRNSNGPEAEQMRQFVANQTEQVKQAVDEFKAAFGDQGLSAERRGAAVQEAIRELRDNGQKGVTALYKQARDLGQEVPLDTAGIRNAYDRLMVEADVPDSVKGVLTQEAARYGIIGKPQVIDKATGVVTAENGITRYKLDSGETRAVYGPPETLRLDNAEAFRQVVSKQYQADGGQKLTQILKSAIDDATEEAATKLAQQGEDGAKVPDALKAAREAHIEQVKAFKAKDVVQAIADWKKGTNTDVLKPEQVMQQALGKTSDLRRVKAVLLSKPTRASKAAWRAIQAHGLADIFAKATTKNTNVAGEITDAISGAKLRSEIDRFGTDKLKVMLEPEQFNQMMRLRKAIEDVTIPISGTTNPSGSGTLLMRLVKDVDNQVTAAFSSAGFALGGPAGAAIGGAAGRAISPAVKQVREAKQAAETVKDATEYTSARAAIDTGEAPPSAAAKAGSAVKKAGATTIKAFIDTYGSPRILAPILATTTGVEQ